MSDDTGDVIRTGQRLELFLKDEAVQAALTAIEEQNYALFLGAKDEEGRRMAQAQALVTKAFEATLRGVVGEGERARIELERRERAPAARPTKE